MAFSKRIPVLVDNTSGLFALSNFQIKIDLSLTEYSNISSVARSDGADIRVFAADGTTPLTYWLAPDWDGSGEGTLYVLIASLSIGATLQIYIYYGDAAVTVSTGDYSACMTKPVDDADTLSLCHMDDGVGAPSTLASDLFTAANGTRLNALGTGWTETVGTWTVQSNKAEAPASTVNAMAWKAAGAPEYVVSVSIVVPSAASYAFGILARFVDSSNFIRAIVQRNASGTPFLAIDKLVSGSYTAPFSPTPFVSSPTGTTITITCAVGGSRIVLTASTGEQTFGDFDEFLTAEKCGLFAYTDSGYVAGAYDTFLVTTIPGQALVDETATHHGIVRGGKPLWDGVDGGNWTDASPRVVFDTGDCPTLNTAGNVFGRNQYLTFGTLFDTWPVAWSIRFRCRPDVIMGVGSASHYWLMSKWNGAIAVDGIQLLVEAGQGPRLEIWYSTSTTVMRAQRHKTLQAGVWYDFAVTGGPAGLQLWINGHMEAIKAGDYLQNGGAVALTPNDGNDNPLTLGMNNDLANGGATGLFFPGAFDQFIAQERQSLPEELHAAWERRQWQLGMEESGRWGAATNVLSITGSGWEQKLVLEPSVIVDGSAYRMSYTGVSAAGASCVGIATSSDALSWTRHGSNPRVGNGVGGEALNANGSCLRKFGSTYYLYYVTGYSAGSMYVATSSDGVTFSGNTLLIAPEAQPWIDLSVSNMVVAYDSANTRYVMLFCQFDLSGGTCRTGLATCATPNGTWALSGSNPLTSMQYDTGLYAPRDLQKIGSLWHCWGHVGFDSTLIPSSIYRWTSPDLVNWTKVYEDAVRPIDGELLTGLLADQVADPSLIDLIGGGSMMFCDVDRNIAGSGQEGRIDRRPWTGTIATMVKDLPWLTASAAETPGGGGGGDDAAAVLYYLQVIGA